MAQVVCVVLSGGKGTRLYPLTKMRAKPAVPFGGKYRLVDIPISNCINSGYKQIYLLTQFNSSSLHNHITHTYTFDSFSHGFVEILAAEQTYEHSGWYQGTADAVRKNFLHLHDHSPDYYIILSGDQLYRMDFMKFLRYHIEKKADITLASTPVPKQKAADLGLIHADKNFKVTKFMEKPGHNVDFSEMKIPEDRDFRQTVKYPENEYLASMGIYIFNAGVLENSLDNTMADLSKEIIPCCIDTLNVYTYIFNHYWVDIGSIKSFFEANINLADIRPKFNFYNEKKPVYTRRRDLPASKINFCTTSQSLTADGCIITNATIMNSIVGIRTIIESGAHLDNAVCMGADYYETDEQTKWNKKSGIPDIGIGKGTIVKRAIIDKNARIGEVCRIGIDNFTREDGDFGDYYIKDNIIIIPKNAVIPSGTVI
ncbi:MAG: glucose-1-phosphate adenylyltransferase [Spirochaetales bacterium]|nr:glucose-1-phosphate adenylyltransferase [Spirochaetales bacterium]